MYYGDDESMDLTNIYFLAVTYHSIRASMQIAKEKGQSFSGFKKSDYASGKYFEKFINPTDPKQFAPRTAKVKKIFKDIFVPTSADWAQLAQDVKENGMYNQNLQAVPPTGSISYINNSTSSIHPVAVPGGIVETRSEGKLGAVYVPSPEAEGNEQYFQNHDMYSIDPKKVLDIYSIAQFYVDQGLSLTLGYNSSSTTKVLVRSMTYAFSKGKASTKELDERGKLLAKYPSAEIKTLYYARIYNENLDALASQECVSCAI